MKLKTFTTILMLIVIILMLTVAYKDIKYNLVKKEFQDITIFQVEQLSFLLNYTNVSYNEFNKAFMQNKLDEILEEEVKQ